MHYVIATGEILAGDDYENGRSHWACHAASRRYVAQFVATLGDPLLAGRTSQLRTACTILRDLPQNAPWDSDDSEQPKCLEWVRSNSQLAVRPEMPSVLGHMVSKTRTCTGLKVARHLTSLLAPRSPRNRVNILVDINTWCATDDALLENVLSNLNRSGSLGMRWKTPAASSFVS